jgi:L-ascorbate metabolism protein UlaG (beta-lactamase superfamily)
MSLALAALFVCGLCRGVSAMDGTTGKETDRIETGKGVMEIVFLGHASLAVAFNGASIYIDPVSQYGDYAKFPKADLILVTHEHADHLDKSAIGALKKPSTRLVLSAAAQKKLGEGEVLEQGNKLTAAGIFIEAVPAYNISAGKTGFHPRDRKDNGYVLTVGNLRIYISGDTEPIPEMALLGHIDIAFLAVNQPYTMTPQQAAEAAGTIKPGILYPYHYGSTDMALLKKLLAASPGVEVRIRNLQ